MARLADSGVLIIRRFRSGDSFRGRGGG
ncbi:hypothetical protein VCHC67A1_01526, partial [Vibrio cholerae HC-67A1]